MSALSSTLDCHGQPIFVGDWIHILDITPDPDMDEDDLEMFQDMIGSDCEVERIDATGSAWVAVWWSAYDGPLQTTVILSPGQMEKASKQDQ